MEQAALKLHIPDKEEYGRNTRRFKGTKQTALTKPYLHQYAMTSFCHQQMQKNQ